MTQVRTARDSVEYLRREAASCQARMGVERDETERHRWLGASQMVTLVANLLENRLNAQERPPGAGDVRPTRLDPAQLIDWFGDPVSLEDAQRLIEGREEPSAVVGGVLLLIEGEIGGNDAG